MEVNLTFAQCAVELKEMLKVKFAIRQRERQTDKETDGQT